MSKPKFCSKFFIIILFHSFKCFTPKHILLFHALGHFSLLIYSMIYNFPTYVILNSEYA